MRWRRSTDQSASIRATLPVLLLPWRGAADTARAIRARWRHTSEAPRRGTDAANRFRRPIEPGRASERTCRVSGPLKHCALSRFEGSQTGQRRPRTGCPPRTTGTQTEPIQSGPAVRSIISMPTALAPVAGAWVARRICIIVPKRVAARHLNELPGTVLVAMPDSDAWGPVRGWPPHDSTATQRNVPLEGSSSLPSLVPQIDAAIENE